MAECIKKNAVLDACIDDKGDIFKEVRKMRKTAPTVSSMELQLTSKLILLMSTRNYTTQLMIKEKLMTVLHHLNTKIDSGSVVEVEKITPALIKEALSKLKND